ncbi:MAG: glycosyltransferase, partial [Cellulosimicrobium funkei]
PTIVATRGLAERVPFASVGRGEDTGFLRSAIDAGARVFSADRYNFVQVRAGAAHTWDVSDAELLASGEVQFYGRADRHALI